MGLPVPAVLFADADSILNDQPSSSPAAVESVLEIVRREDIPVVFWSSRTRAELEFIGQERSLSHPFISENGGGLFIPRGYFGFEVPWAVDRAGYEAIEFGKPYADVCKALRR